MRTQANHRRTGALFLIIAGAGLALSSCAKLTVEEARLYQIGIDAQRAERWSEAAGHLSVLLESHPGHAAALLHRGVCRYHLRREKEAIDDLEQALRAGGLEPSDVHRGLYYLARSRLEWLRKRSPSGESPEAGEEKSVEAALDELDAALEIEATYDIWLWKAYCHMKLQGFDAALAAISECKVLGPDRLGHHLIEAMTLERSQPRRGVVGDRSVRIYLDLLARDRERSLDLLYEHLSEINGHLDEHVQEQVLPHLEDYLRLRPERSAGIRDAVTAARREREKRRIERTLRELLETVRRLEAQSHYEEALRAVEESRGQLPELDQVDALQRRLEEKWSIHLEVQADTARLHGDRAAMRRGLIQLEKALALTRSPRRRAILQQKVDTFRVVLCRVPDSGGLTRAQDLLWEGKTHDALEHLERIREEELFETHRDAYHYLLGLAHYELKNWKEAVDQFEQVTESKFFNFDVFSGVCLYRSGRQSEGLEKLKQVDIDARPEEALRILGAHFYSRGDYEAALENLERLRQPRRDDHEALQGTLTALGERAVATADWRQAVDLLRRARQVVESRLNQHGTVVYTFLGKAYWHLGDYARAERVLEDLFSVEIPADQEPLIRDAFLYRGLLAHRRRDASRALEDFRKYLFHGGAIPTEFLPSYHEALGLAGDFLPISRVSSWIYTDTESGGRLQFRVVEEIGDGEGRYRVERIQGAANETREEIWTVDGTRWRREWETTSGTESETLPIRRTSLTDPAEAVESRTASSVRVSKVLSIGESVDLDGGRIYTDCCLVETRIDDLGGGPRRRRLHYLAPGVGEVKREFFEGETKTGEWTLDEVEYR